MAKFKYTAIDQNGKQKTGSIDAESQDDASSKVSAMGLMPTNITAGGGSSAKTKKVAKAKGKSGGMNFGKVIKPEELTTFTRQLATLLQAG